MFLCVNILLEQREEYFKKMFIKDIDVNDIFDLLYKNLKFPGEICINL